MEMSPTLRAELDRIEEFLMGPEGGSLIDVLAALCGPDNSMGALKATTTNFIRRAAFPKLVRERMHHGRWETATEGVSVVAPIPQACDYDHFLCHIRLAAEVLGLVEKETPARE